METETDTTKADTVAIIDLIAEFDPRARDEYQSGNMAYEPDIDSLEVIDLEMRLEDHFGFYATDEQWSDFEVGTTLAKIVEITNKLRNIQ